MSAKEDLLRLADEMKYLSAAEWVDSETVRKWQSELVTIANDMPVEGGEAARYFASGPQGHFFADDHAFAERLIKPFDRDDWTVTDLQAALSGRTGEAASA